MNSGIIIGRLTRDPELRYGKSGTAFCNFTVAVDRPMTKDKTDFPQVLCIQKTAENCAKYLVKGSQVAVEGSFQTSSYKNADGDTVYKEGIFANNVQFLSKSKEKTDETNIDNEIKDDDISF